VSRLPGFVAKKRIGRTGKMASARVVREAMSEIGMSGRLEGS